MSACPNCRKNVPEGEKFCPGCGSLQPKVAPTKMDGTAQTAKGGILGKMAQPSVSGPETVPVLPSGWNAPKARASGAPTPASPGSATVSTTSTTKGTSETVVGQTTGANKTIAPGAGAPCKKCQEPTGDAKFCPKCGELQPGGPTGSLGGIVSPRAKGH